MVSHSNEFTVPAAITELLSASQHGLHEIAGKLSELLGVPIIMSDPFYNVLSSSIDSTELEMVVSTHFESYQNTLFFKCGLDLNQQSYESFGYPIKSGNQNLGFLFILSDYAQHRLIDQYASLIQYTASLCLLRLKQVQEIHQEQHRFKDAFLFDILYGNMKNRNDIVTYGTTWKWDFEVPHMVIVFSLTDYNHFSADKSLIESLFYIIEKSLHQHGVEPITIKKQGEIVTILPAHDKTNYHRKKVLTDFIKYTFNQTNDTSLSDRVACGVGQIYKNPEELYRSYQEAKVAFELGLLLKIEFPFFNDLGLERVLYKHDLQDLKEFFQHVIGDLQKYDSENESQLMDTLESFANHQFDLKQTSEAIYLHRNTLRYRIKKIEEILNIKLDDINNRLNIVAAFKIKTLHKL